VYIKISARGVMQYLGSN